MKDCHITIEGVDNGVVVRGHAYPESTGRAEPIGEGKEVEYVYKSIEEAMKELPGVWSVLKEGGMPDDRSKQEKVQDRNMPKEPKKGKDY